MAAIALVRKLRRFRSTTTHLRILPIRPNIMYHIPPEPAAKILPTGQRRGYDASEITLREPSFEATIIDRHNATRNAAA
jgi:hypothetical protein